MRKFILFSVLIFSFSLNAQIGTSTSWGGENSKWTFGGSAGIGGTFGSGNSGTSISISPRVGYQLTNDLEGGVAGNFGWTNSKYYSSSTVGVGPFLNYYFSRNFYLSGMFQEYFFNQKDKYTQL